MTQNSSREQGSPEADSNTDRAAVGLASYLEMKRIIGWRSVLLVSSLALLLWLRYPALALDLELGGLVGVGNMLLMMRGNERFLSRKTGRARRTSDSLQRLIIMAVVPVITTFWSPWWAMAVTLSGIFLPLCLYVFELQYRYRTGKT